MGKTQARKMKPVKLRTKRMWFGQNTVETLSGGRPPAQDILANKKVYAGFYQDGRERKEPSATRGRYRPDRYDHAIEVEVGYNAVVRPYED